jgi:hypothetical protein
MIIIWRSETGVSEREGNEGGGVRGTEYGVRLSAMDMIALGRRFNNYSLTKGFYSFPRRSVGTRGTPAWERGKHRSVGTRGNYLHRNATEGVPYNF